MMIRPDVVLAGLLLAGTTTVATIFFDRRLYELHRRQSPLTPDGPDICLSDLTSLTLGPYHTWREASSAITSLERCLDRQNATKEFLLDIDPDKVQRQQSSDAWADLLGLAEDELYEVPPVPYTFIEDIIEVFEHMPNLENLTIRLPPERVSSFWQRFNREGLVLESVKTLAIGEAMDWIRDLCPNLEKVAPYTTGQHRDRLRYVSARTCDLAEYKLSHPRITSHGDWFRAANTIARLEPCIRELAHARSLYVDINVKSRAGCFLDTVGPEPPADLPERLVRLMRAMETVGLSTLRYPSHIGEQFSWLGPMLLRRRST